jgi:2-dehydro-3-deoxyphosphogalactonate aldolase
VKKPLVWEQGYMLPPTEPGLGIELNESVLEANPYTSGGRLHLEMSQTPLSSANDKIISEIE